MSVQLLSADGRRIAPPSFVRLLAQFDRDLRVVWGFSLGKPFPGWVIERRIPGHMKAKVYGSKPANRTRFADQWIVDEKGKTVTRRSFDMMPDWHPVYRIVGEDNEPILELGEHVIDYLRQHRNRTLLGFPELSMRHHEEDLREQAAMDEKRDEQLIAATAEKIMDRKTEIFPESFHFGGQPETVMKGTKI